LGREKGGKSENDKYGEKNHDVKDRKKARGKEKEALRGEGDGPTDGKEKRVTCDTEEGYQRGQTRSPEKAN